ncbi:hypothetical protein ACOACQ_17620 [Nocardioides sp. CPCC 206347]|uniref:hypothetical protein n=1 Tax=Nocardioides sp. CPCC 206347 TaxID=3406463 RepID=UPI003B42CA7A
MSTEAWADGLDLFRAAGVIVVPIEDFRYQVAWVDDCQVLLVAADLTDEERREVVSDYLPAVLIESPEADQ